MSCASSGQSVELPDLVFFFDRSVGTALPLALKSLDVPLQIQHHDAIFESDAHDDVWLPEVGRDGWFVIGHDARYHVRPTELAAIRQYAIGCFYLWGGDQPRWEAVRCFARAYDKIVHEAETHTRPFVFRVHKSGKLVEVYLP